MGLRLGRGSRRGAAALAGCGALVAALGLSGCGSQNQPIATNSAATGSDFVKVGKGELVLSGNSSYRGNTYIGSPISPPAAPAPSGDAPLPDVNEVDVSGSFGAFVAMTWGGEPANWVSRRSLTSPRSSSVH